MNFLKNKYLILGNIILLLIGIPITLFFVKKQQEVRSRAAPSSKLFFSPENVSTSTQCSNFNVDIMIDPGTNAATIVDFYIKYDPTKLEILQVKESDKFPSVARPLSMSSGEANIQVSVGGNVTNWVTSISKVATITFKPKGSAGEVQVTFDSEKSKVYSQAPADYPTENVLFSVAPTNVTIGTGACLSGGTTPSPTLRISPTAPVTPTSSPSPTISAVNQAPVCTDLSVSPATSGSAPFSVLFTAKGNDPDLNGVIAKTTFNFGDGKVQDVTDGMNLKNVTVQTNHTFQTGGTYGATVTFTDDKSVVSQSCTQTITVSGASGSATITPTTTATPTAASTTAPTAAPTIPPTGGLGTTVGIIGAILLTIIGGFLLLTL